MIEKTQIINQLKHMLSIRFGLIGDSLMEGTRVMFLQQVGNTFWNDEHQKGTKGYGADDVLNDLIKMMSIEINLELYKTNYLKLLFPKISIQMHADVRSGLCLAHKDPTVDPNNIANLLYGPSLAQSGTQSGVYDCLFVGLGINDALKDFNTLTIQSLFQLIKKNNKANDVFYMLFSDIDDVNDGLFCKLESAFNHIKDQNNADQIVPDYSFNKNEFDEIKQVLFSKLSSAIPENIMDFISRWKKEQFGTHSREEITASMDLMFNDFKRSQVSTNCKFAIFLPPVPREVSCFNLFQPLERIQNNIVNMRDLLKVYAKAKEIPCYDLNTVCDCVEKAGDKAFGDDNVHLTDDFYIKFNDELKDQIIILLQNTIVNRIKTELANMELDLEKVINNKKTNNAEKNTYLEVLNEVSGAINEVNSLFSRKESTSKQLCDNKSFNNQLKK